MKCFQNILWLSMPKQDLKQVMVLFFQFLYFENLVYKLKTLVLLIDFQCTINSHEIIMYDIMIIIKKLFYKIKETLVAIYQQIANHGLSVTVLMLLVCEI